MMTVLLELFQAMRALLVSALSPRPSARRNIVVLLVALIAIPVWQRGFLAPESKIPATHTVRASTGIHGEPRFFFFLYHLGLIPLKSTAPLLADTKEEALRHIREHGKGLVVDEGVTFGSGDRGRVYLYFVDAWLNHRSIEPKLLYANSIGFGLSLCALFTGFWWIRKPWMGAIAVVLLGSNPFQLYITYRQENVFGWAITTALFMMAMHLPLMTSRAIKARWVWYMPVVAGLVLSMARTVRSEGSLMAVSVILVYMTLAGATWKKRAALSAIFVVTLTVAGFGYVKHFERKFQQSHSLMVKAGGTPYTGPLQIYHEIWHPIFCGLGDYDTKYGYKWDDRVGYAYAYPILTGKYGLKLPHWQPDWYTFNATYDDNHTYPIFFGQTPHYNDVIRDKVLGDIKRDPKWYFEIIKKRIWRVLTETSPLSVYTSVKEEPYTTSSPLMGLLCVPLALFLALARRWTHLKILIFTLPLTAPALIIFSDKGMTFYSTFHYFGFAILCSVLAAGARSWLRKPADL